jgi:hypothetical protein
MKLIWVAGMVTLILFSIQVARAGPDECSDAVDAYKSAADDVEMALQSYTSCVSSSDGKDDCSSEFGSLQSAQSDFESAVSDYESECS